ncbi:hypothetical protein [Sphingomonas sp. Leaf10]|uniref:hypothetical protein n=1 Tax=Sphingomonas sp. Leaf10 TaxID=1735676 RepID=UPI0006FBBC1B|nr:hypothetical protein [Sphingomonas sp. Leaf10]KQM41271.1 hypothetical protein ASE59_03045 [Sphingomonas sp. Leaf10]
MKIVKMLCVAAVAGASMSAAIAQDSAAPLTAVARGGAAANAQLPANTEILLSMNEDLTTKGGRIEVGYKFGLTVAADVMLGDYVVIPKGTPAVGEVTWLTGKGAFGKSGKMEIQVRSIDLNGRRIPVTGKYRQEGEGNTVATVASVALLWPAAPFVTGKSARIPAGRELKAFTESAVPVAVPATAAVSVGTPVVAVAASTVVK